jgi:RNA polymerase sigma factor (sigma-70 family)
MELTEPALLSLKGPVARYYENVLTRVARLGSGHSTRTAQFEEAVLPHLNAAYNLARWLTQNDHDAEDVVQEAYLRALQFFDGFRGGESRAWLLSIVRNTCYTWLRKNRPSQPAEPFDEEIHSGVRDTKSPETAAIENADRRMLQAALEELPLEFREVLVLRELEGLSYEEIAAVAGIPAGTVMSRLARARRRLAQQLASQLKAESQHDL